MAMRTTRYPLLLLAAAFVPACGDALAGGGAAAATPVFIPATADASTNILVTIDVPAGTHVRWTSNGSQPSRGVGTAYTGPIAIPHGSVGLTLRAVAWRDGGPDSPVAVAGPFSVHGWRPLGIQGFSAGESSCLRLAVDATGPLVALRDSGSLNRIALLRFQYGSWRYVVNPGMNNTVVPGALDLAADGASTIVVAGGNGGDNMAGVYAYAPRPDGTWSNLGPAPFSIDGSGSRQPSVALVAGTPYCAYLETAFRVHRWTGAAWVTNGMDPGLAVGGGDIVRLVAGTQSLFLAWYDTGITTIRVYAYSNSAWSSLGFISPGVSVSELVLAVDGETPYVAWVALNSASVQRRVGGAWQAVGAADFCGSLSVGHTAFALLDGVPYLAGVNAFDKAPILRRWSGAGWGEVSILGLPAGGIAHPALAAYQGTPLIGYADGDRGWRLSVQRLY